MKFLLIFSILLLTPFIASADVIISEVAWMGTGNSANDEWIELYSDEDIDLTGYILEAFDGSPSINLEGIITANSYFLLERTDDTSVPDITADQIYTGALSNSGEYLKLKDASNTVVDEINATEEWPGGDNSTKQTMQLVDNEWKTSNPTPKAANSAPTEEKPAETPTTTTKVRLPIADAGNDIIGFIGQEISFNGTSSSDPNGYELAYSWNMGNGELIEKDIFTYVFSYPGTYLVTLMVYNGRNYAWDTITVKIQNQEITISEFMANPIGDDEEGEYIEVFNGSNSIVDISGWQLDDMDGGSKPFTFPEHTLIAPKNYLVFPRTITNIALNNASDSVRLLLPEGIIFQEVKYEDCKEGQSSAYTDEGFVWAVPTPGSENIVRMPTQATYQYEPEKQIVKESSKEYTIEYSPPEQTVQEGYTESQNEPSYIKTSEDELAMIKPALKQEVGKKSAWSLILMIFIVIFLALIIGLLLTKFLKKPT